jgi:hypothetical protein
LLRTKRIKHKKSLKYIIWDFKWQGNTLKKIWFRHSFKGMEADRLMSVYYKYLSFKKEVPWQFFCWNQSYNWEIRILRHYFPPFLRSFISRDRRDRDYDVLHTFTV